MPIYEYQCSHCNHCFDLFHKMDDTETKLCPKCSQIATRLVSPTGFQLKGTGWYVTDFKNKQPPNNPKDKENKTVEEKAAKPAEAKVAKSTENTTKSGEKN